MIEIVNEWLNSCPSSLFSTITKKRCLLRGLLNILLVFSLPGLHEFPYTEKPQTHDSTKKETEQINHAVHCTEQELSVHSSGNAEETELSHKMDIWQYSKFAASNINLLKWRQRCAWGQHAPCIKTPVPIVFHVNPHTSSITQDWFKLPHQDMPGADESTLHKAI